MTDQPGGDPNPPQFPWQPVQPGQPGHPGQPAGPQPGQPLPPQFPLLPPPPGQTYPGQPPYRSQQQPYPGQQPFPGQQPYPGQQVYPPGFTQAQWQQMTPDQWRAAWKAAYPPPPKRFDPIATFLVGLLVVVLGVAATRLIRQAPVAALALTAVLFLAGLLVASRRGRPLLRGSGLGMVMGTSFLLIIGGSLFVLGALYNACVQAFTGSSGAATPPTVTGSPFPDPSQASSATPSEAGTP